MQCLYKYMKGKKEGELCGKTSEGPLCATHRRFAVKYPELIKQDVEQYHIIRMIYTVCNYDCPGEKMNVGDRQIQELLKTQNENCKCGKRICWEDCYIIKNDMDYDLIENNLCLVCKRCREKARSRKKMFIEF